MRHVCSRLAFLSLVVLLVVCGAGAAWAQGTSSLRGVVTDPQKAVIPGATITITNTATGLSRSVISDDTGNYTFTQVPPGTYSVKMELTGFKTVVYDNIPLQVN